MGTVFFSVTMSLDGFIAPEGMDLGGEAGEDVGAMRRLPGKDGASHLDDDPLCPLHYLLPCFLHFRSAGGKPF